MIVRRCGGELNIAFSGDRDSHTCPWGKTEMVRSSDEGNWSATADHFQNARLCTTA